MLTILVPLINVIRVLMGEILDLVIVRLEANTIE